MKCKTIKKSTLSFGIIRVDPDTNVKIKNIHIVFAILLVFGVLYGLFRISSLRTFQFFGGLTNRVQTDENVVALTFDDGPSEYSNEVVNILSEKSVPATFYVIGQNIEQYPAETKYIVEKGHELGNHSFSHPRFVLKSFSFINMEIQKTNRLIRKSGYTGEITFRPPFGKKLFALPRYLQIYSMKTITWDVEPDTYMPGDAGGITAYTLEHTKPGSIILLHPFCVLRCSADREALPQIIDGLRDRGYTFLTVTELLKYNRKTE